jgi:hypothetical protein
MLILLFVSIESQSSSPEISTLFTGNWSAKVVSAGSNASALPSTFNLRFLPPPGLAAVAYETNTSDKSLFSLPLRITRSDSLKLGDQEAILVDTLRAYKSASGRYQNYLYHFIIGGATKLSLQLIDDATGEFAVITFVRHEDRTPPSWFARYGPIAVLVAILLVSQLFTTLSERKIKEGRQQSGSKASATAGASPTNVE